jgi:ABC-2 type transport system ATP-binding protein
VGLQPDPAIVAAGLTKRFGTHVAVDAVDLRVEAGQIHGLLGPNGAGKTTLLRMLLGLVSPDRGTLSVLGRTPFAARGALPGLAGFVEAPRFYPYLSAAKNLDLLAALDGNGSTRRVDELLEQVGLRGRSREKVRGFSTGMRQRLGLAAVLLRDPRLLVLDEPTTGLDPAGVRELHQVIADVATSGRTVLLSSHDMAEVEGLCDAVSILRDGRLVHHGSLSELRERASAPTFLLSTADDRLAGERVARSGGALLSQDDQGLVVRATQRELDDLVLDLASCGLAVRGLVRRDTALNALFLRLTAEEPQGGACPEEEGR